MSSLNKNKISTTRTRLLARRARALMDARIEQGAYNSTLTEKAKELAKYQQTAMIHTKQAKGKKLTKEEFLALVEKKRAAHA